MKRFITAAFCIGLSFGLPVSALAEEHAKTSTDDIAIFATMDVTQENFEAFKAALGPIVDVVQGEEGTLIYDYLRAGDTVYLYERYEDTAAFMAHLENTGALMGELFAVAQITSVVSMTPIPDELKPVLEQFQAIMTVPVTSKSN